MKIYKNGLCLALVLSLSLTGFGDSWTDNGVTFSYTVSNGEACFVSIISCGDSASVVIPSEINGYKVTSIGWTSPTCRTKLASVVVPNGVTSIGQSAFKGCSGLISVTIPNSVTSIDWDAFRDCSRLTSVSIPSSVTSIGWQAFDGCPVIDTTTIKGLNLVDGWIVGCNSDCPSDLILENIRGIGNDAFWGCTNLTSVTIPNNVTSISDDAFGYCSGLTSVTIPNSVTSIGCYAFVGCTNLTSMTLPSSVTSIGEHAFRDCAGLKSVTIPSSVTSIDVNAFRDCSGLESVTIQDGVTSIGWYAFYGCSSLASVTIPASVTSIGYAAFYGCSGLVSAVVPACRLSSMFPDSKCLQRIEIADGVTSIGDSAFFGCRGLTSVTIPDSVTNIGAYAFSGCSGLTSMTVPDSVTNICESAFRGCSGIMSISVPGSVTSIGIQAFFGCNGLTSVTIPDSVTRIGERAFFYCRSLTSVTIPDSVKEIGRWAFRYCNLSEVSIPADATIYSSSFDSSVRVVGRPSITYANLKGAANPNPATYEEGKAFALAAPGAVTGYTFAGWTPSAITADMTGAQTVTANWTAHRYQIAYKENGCSDATATTDCTYDAEVEIAASEFAYAGYVFKGWATEEGGEVVYAPGDKVTNLTSNEGGVVTLYAVWAVDEPTPNPPMALVEGVAISPSGEIAVAAKGAKQIVKISGSGEEWTAATSDDWLKLNSTSGVATDKSIICTIAENAAAESRIGYVYIAGQTLKVSQEGRGATVEESVVADTAGGEVAVSVSVLDETTTWSASSACPWVQVERAKGVGSGEARFLVLPWNRAAPRAWTVTVAGQTVTLTQRALAFECPTSTATNVVADGESGAFTIATDSAVTWTVTSDAEWLVVENDGVSRSGAGMVSWEALPQSLFTERTATITVTPAEESGFKPWMFTVTQKAATLELSATSAAVLAQGEEISVSVATADGIQWMVSDVPEWVTLDGDAERTGSDSVSLVVSPNTTFEIRFATILIAGKAFTLTQEAAKVEIEGGLVRCCNSAGLDSLVVTVRVDVATASWAPEISEEAEGVWVFLMSGEEPVTGDGTFDLYIASATEGDALPRTATVTVGNAILRIVQGDGVVVEGVDTPFVIPTSWFEKYYSTQGGTTPDEWQKIAEGAGVKTDASGAALPVWHDYVAGTDPTDAESRFAASVVLEDGKPVVSWSPALNGDGVREGVRTYRVWGKANLTDAAWSEVAPDGEPAYRFFRVSVEMP